MKYYDPKKEGRELAQVLKHNPELSAPEKAEELALVLELRLEQAYSAGKNGQPKAEKLYEQPAGDDPKTELAKVLSQYTN